MKANSDALEKLLGLKKRWDTVIVYPAFGNEVGLFLARHLEANLVLYITDMPTTAAWLDHVYGTYSGQGELFRDEAVQSAVVEVVARHISDPDLTKSVTVSSHRRVCQILCFQDLHWRTGEQRQSHPGPGQPPYHGGTETRPSQPRLLRDDAVQGGRASAGGPPAVPGLGYRGSRPRLLRERPAGISGERLTSPHLT